MRRDRDVRIVFDEMGGPLTGSNGTLMLVRMPEKTIEDGAADLRRLLIIGASAVVRWASRRGAVEGYWLSRMIGKKPPMLITVALANRMVPVAWALMTNGGRYEEKRLAA